MLPESAAILRVQQLSCIFDYDAPKSTRLETVAMKLPLRDRVQLAQRLVSTLDEEVETDTEARWFAEAERRLEELRSGRLKALMLMTPSVVRAKLSSNESHLPF